MTDNADALNRSRVPLDWLEVARSVLYLVPELLGLRPDPWPTDQQIAEATVESTVRRLAEGLAIQFDNLLSRVPTRSRLEMSQKHEAEAWTGEWDSAIDREICYCGCSYAEHGDDGRCRYCLDCDKFMSDHEANCIAAAFSEQEPR